MNLQFYIYSSDFRGRFWCHSQSWELLTIWDHEHLAHNRGSKTVVPVFGHPGMNRGILLTILSKVCKKAAVISLYSNTQIRKMDLCISAAATTDTASTNTFVKIWIGHFDRLWVLWRGSRPFSVWHLTDTLLMSLLQSLSVCSPFVPLVQMSHSTSPWPPSAVHAFVKCDGMVSLTQLFAEPISRCALLADVGASFILGMKFSKVHLSNWEEALKSTRAEMSWPTTSEACVCGETWAGVRTATQTPEDRRYKAGSIVDRWLWVCHWFVSKVADNHLRHTCRIADCMTQYFPNHLRKLVVWCPAEEWWSDDVMVIDK